MTKDLTKNEDNKYKKSADTIEKSCVNQAENYSGITDVNNQVSLHAVRQGRKFILKSLDQLSNIF